MEELVAAIAEYRKQRETHGCEVELEFRLGSKSDASFCPGVSKDVFTQLDQDMCESELQIGDLGFREHVDYHYTDASGKQLRTRVTFDSANMSMGVEHTQKIVCSRFHVQASDQTGDNSIARLSIAHEIPVVDPPVSCIPTCVRIQQRKRFRDVRDGVTIWSYDLSRTWSASSRNAVEHKQHVSEPMYEVECELVDEQHTYLQSLTNNDIANTLLLKIKMLLGEDDSACLEIINTHIGHNNTQNSSRRSRRSRNTRKR